jgi:peptide-methionine (S)-S-oxide reductase
MINLTIVYLLFQILLFDMQPVQTNRIKMNGYIETATLGGGCFWCTQAVFDKIKGVVSVTCGYSGGFTKNPSYQEVCTGSTGHAEVVQIKFKPAIISFREILDIFFSSHDPTSLNRQGADVGTQYRSVIFYENIAQKNITEEKINELKSSGIYSQPVVTQVEKLNIFYKAEDYHQNYFAKNPNAAYCKIVIKPKVEKLEKNFIQMLK